MYKPKSYEYVFVVLYLVIQNKTNLPEVIIIDSETHNDFRGFLRIGYGKEELQHIGIHFEIEQINYGYSVHEHTLRGMHFQEGEYAQAKLVPCLQGASDCRHTLSTVCNLKEIVSLRFFYKNISVLVNNLKNILF